MTSDQVRKPQLFVGGRLVYAMQWNGTEECRAAINAWLGRAVMWNCNDLPLVKVRGDWRSAEIGEWLLQEIEPDDDRFDIKADGAMQEWWRAKELSVAASPGTGGA